MEQHEVPNDPDAIDELIEQLYGDQDRPRDEPLVPLGLERCRRCSCCGRPIVGFDSPDLFRVN